MFKKDKLFLYITNDKQAMFLNNLINLFVFTDCGTEANTDFRCPAILSTLPLMATHTQVVSYVCVIGIFF